MKSLSILLLYKNTQGVNSHGLVGELLRNNGYAKLKDYGIVSDTLNDKKCGYGYSDGTTPEGDCGFAGVFSSECSSEAAKMIKVSMDCNRIAVRASNFNGTWSSWSELSFKFVVDQPPSIIDI